MRLHNLSIKGKILQKFTVQTKSRPFKIECYLHEEKINQTKMNTHLFIWTPLISGFGLGPRCSLNVTSRCLAFPPKASDIREDTEKNDKSVVTLSCDGERNMRHDNGVAGAVDVRCLLIVWYGNAKMFSWFVLGFMFFICLRCLRKCQ